MSTWLSRDRRRTIGTVNATLTAHARGVSPAAPGATATARLTASIDPGWHLYSLSTPKGPIPTTVRIADNPAVVSYRVYQPKPAVKFDPNFQADTETFDNQAVFWIAVELAKDAAGKVELAAQLLDHGARSTSRVCADVPMKPCRSKISAVVTPTPSGPIEPRARNAKSDPTGTRCRCTAVSVFMNTN